MGTVEQMRKMQRAEGAAEILAIATAVPSNCIYQADCPDLFFRLYNSDHLTDLKDKFKRICEKTTIKKRHMLLSEEILKKNPNLRTYLEPSFSIRQEILATEIPKLSQEAAEKAIKEWGQPKSRITHLVFHTSAVPEGMPGPDYKIVELLGLNPSVRRVPMYMQGCSAGGTALRVAKDLSENNKGARVLVICCEMTISIFRAPSSSHLDSLVNLALFGDGAAALIIGADPDTSRSERPLYQMVSAAQTIIPNSDHCIIGTLREYGLDVHLSKDICDIMSKNMEDCLIETFTPIGIKDWNSIFWVTHPGGPAILDKVELNLGLKKEKLRASRHVLREYGNGASVAVLFVLDEMRKKSFAEGKVTTGEGMDWGVLFGFGPGLTVETIALHSVPIQKYVEL